MLGRISFLNFVWNYLLSRDAFEFVLKNADDVKGVSKGIVFLKMIKYPRLSSYTKDSR